MGFGGFVALGFGLGESAKLHFPPVEAHSSISALTFGYLFFPSSFFFSSLFSSVPWNLVVFHFGGQEVSYSEWSELSGTGDTFWMQISEQMSEIPGMQMDENLNNDILKIWRAGQ